MLKRSFRLLLGLLKLLSAFCADLKFPPLLAKDMRRLVTADRISVRFRYFKDEKEVGNVLYNMQDGCFFVFKIPKTH